MRKSTIARVSEKVRESVCVCVYEHCGKGEMQRENAIRKEENAREHDGRRMTAVCE